MQSGKNPKILIFIGFGCIQLCLLMMLGFSPLSSKYEILNMLYMRGFALAFLFVPINSSILSQYSGQAMGQVAGMLNLFRQIGGSVGIAFVATLLKTKSYQNYTDMSSNVTALHPGAMQFQNNVATSMQGKFSSAVGFGSPEMSAAKVLWGKVQAQVFMQSFLQLVTVLIIVMMFAAIPIYRLKLKKGPVKVVDAH